MENLKNAVMIRRMPEPINAQLPDVLIYMIVTDMMDTTWGVLEHGYTSTSEMVQTRQNFINKCKEASYVLYLSGTGDDRTWAIQPIFTEDYPIPDTFDELPVIFPVGVKYHDTVYSFDLDAYLAMPHRDYLPSIKRMYADILGSVQ